MWYATQARDAYPYYQHTAIGYNYRMSNVCAGIGRGQMTVLDEHIAHHKHVQALYEELLADVPGVKMHKQHEHGRHTDDVRADSGIGTKLKLQGMTIKTLIDTIERERQKRDFAHELTPPNKALAEKMCSGTFEAVVTGNGEEKCLVPQVGMLHFLYRGQNREVAPCIPSIYRGTPSDEDVFIERMRLVVFKRLLHSHPVVNSFFKRHHFKVDEEGLAQHYGLKTEVLDLTSSLDVALFFATCWYDVDNDCYRYYDDALEHEAILYVFDPFLDNEPVPSVKEENYMNHNIRPIGLQVFPRPGMQEGYGLHIHKGGSVKCYMYRFTFTTEDSKYYYDKFKRGESLWIKDKFIGKTAEIANQSVFSFSVFDEAFRDYRPKGFSATKLKKALKGKVVLRTKVEDILFSASEKAEIIEDWNQKTGKRFSEIIYRKRWFEHDPIDGDNDAEVKLTGIRNEHDFRSLSRISVLQMLVFIACPDKPEGAEWINYTGLPRPKENPRGDNGEWKKVPASMEDVFGKPYLAEEDWKI